MGIIDIYRKNKNLVPFAVRSRFLALATKLGLVDRLFLRCARRFYASCGIIQKGDLVYDVGANIGDYTQMYLDLGARVVAVEPQPNLVEKLRGRFAGRDVQVVPNGLDARESELELFICDVDGASTFSTEWRDVMERDSRKEGYNRNFSGRKIKVKNTTLDILIAKYGVPKYCKIDVEGFERPVLSGLSRKIHYISFEAHCRLREEAFACIDLLDLRVPCRFNYTDWWPERFALPDWTDSASLKKALNAEWEKNATWGGDIFVKSE